MATFIGLMILVVGLGVPCLLFNFIGYLLAKYIYRLPYHRYEDYEYNILTGFVLTIIIVIFLIVAHALGVLVYHG